MRNRLTFGIAVGALVSAIALAAPDDAKAQSKILRADTGSPGNMSHTSTMVLSKIWSRELGTSTQINDSQTLTRSALKLGRGQLEMMPFPTAVYEFLSKGSRMYKKKLHKQAIAASKNVRAIFGFVAAYFHPVAFESAGIKTWQDIKGKRVFTGPPSGAAAVLSEHMIRSITGFEANRDYKAIRLPWGGGLQAMLDGKLDLYIRPVPVGAAAIEQLGIKQKFMLLDAGDAVNSAAWKKFMSIPGRKTGVIPAGTYKGQLNKTDIKTGGTTFQYAVNKSLPDDLVYRMVKATWDNLGEIHKTSIVLKQIVKETPFIGVNMPLHKAAVKYYRDNGFQVPARLVPPEAR